MGQEGRPDAPSALTLSLVDHASFVPTGVVDARLRILEANAQLAALLGTRSERAVGRTLTEALAPVDVDAVQRAVTAAITSGEPILGLRLKDVGEGCAWQLSIVPGKDAAAVVAEDISERLACEAEEARSRRSASLLAAAGVAIGSTLEITTTIEEAKALLVPDFADRVLFRFEPGWASREYRDDGERSEPMPGLLAATVRDVSATGVAALVIPSEVHRVSAACVPLLREGATFGVMAAVADPAQRRYDEADLECLRGVAERVATALTKARAYERSRQTVIELQQALLPSIPALPVVKVAKRYLPASRAETIGGDWFDVIPGAGGRVAFVIGDVVGHGVRAAAAMGQLRTAVRTLAATDPSPPALLSALGRVVAELDLVPFATCLYATYDPQRRQLELASAGHLPPVFMPANGPARVVDELVIEPPLGADAGVFSSLSIGGAEGATLVMYTDGLVEQPDRDIEERLAMLRRSVSAPADSLEARCDAVLADMVPQGSIDDIAVLMVELGGLAASAVSEWSVGASHADIGAVRHGVRERALAWGAARHADTLELLTSELVTNAIRHGGLPVTVRLLRLADRITCEVHDSDYRTPALRPPDLDSPSGRGLQLVQMLAERWGTRSTPAGKVVWFELAAAPVDGAAVGGGQEGGVRR